MVRFVPVDEDSLETDRPAEASEVSETTETPKAPGAAETQGSGGVKAGAIGSKADNTNLDGNYTEQCSADGGKSLAGDKAGRQPPAAQQPPANRQPLTDQRGRTPTNSVPPTTREQPQDKHDDDPPF